MANLHVQQSSQTIEYPSSTSQLLCRNVFPSRSQGPYIRLCHILYLSFVQWLPLTGQNLSEPHGHHCQVNNFQASGLYKRFQANEDVPEQELVPQDRTKLLLRRTYALDKDVTFEPPVITHCPIMIAYLLPCVWIIRLRLQIPVSDRVYRQSGMRKRVGRWKGAWPLQGSVFLLWCVLHVWFWERGRLSLALS